MDKFLEALRHSLSKNGFHAPKSCAHHIAPRDKPSEVRCPKCSVLMCDKEDMPAYLRDSLVVALAEFLTAHAVEKVEGIDFDRRFLAHSNVELQNQVERLYDDLNFINCKAEDLRERLDYSVRMHTVDRDYLYKLRRHVESLIQERNTLRSVVKENRDKVLELNKDVLTLKKLMEEIEHNARKIAAIQSSRNASTITDAGAKILEVAAYGEKPAPSFPGHPSPEGACGHPGEDFGAVIPFGDDYVFDFIRSEFRCPLHEVELRNIDAINYVAKDVVLRKTKMLDRFLEIHGGNPNSHNAVQARELQAIRFDLAVYNGRLKISEYIIKNYNKLCERSRLGV